MKVVKILLKQQNLIVKFHHGPYVYNFEDIYKILEVNNISKKVENFEDLSSNLFIDLKHEN